MDNIQKLWIDYNYISNKLAEELGRTNNIVGEYAEYLANKYLKGELLPASNKSADIKDNKGNLYQIKSRKRTGNRNSKLSVIRSWDFDFLIIILFNENGTIFKAISMTKEEAKKISKEDKHQNGNYIIIDKSLLNNKLYTDLTDEIKSNII